MTRTKSQWTSGKEIDYYIHVVIDIPLCGKGNSPKRAYKQEWRNSHHLVMSFSGKKERKNRDEMRGSLV